MAIRSAQATLNQWYAVRDAAIVALANPQAEIVKYTLDGRSVEIRAFADLKQLESLIQQYEAAVVSATPVYADFSESCD